MQPTKTKDRMTFGNAPLAPHYIFLFPQLYKQNVGTYVIYCRIHYQRNITFSHLCGKMQIRIYTPYWKFIKYAQNQNNNIN